MIAGVVLLTIFVAQQLRAGPRLVDLELLRKPRFAWSTVAIATIMFAVGGVLFILTPFLQSVAAAGLVALFLPARAAAADR